MTGVQTCALPIYNGNRLNLLISRKALPAGIAETAAADGTVILCRSGINDPGVLLAAIWTFHSESPSFLLVLPQDISQLKSHVNPPSSPAASL